MSQKYNLNVMFMFTFYGYNDLSHENSSQIRLIFDCQNVGFCEQFIKQLIAILIESDSEIGMVLIYFFFVRKY